MIVLITGAAGFIGSHLCEKVLNNNDKVIGIDNFDTYYSKEIKKDNLRISLSNKDFRFYQIDIRDSRKIDKIITEERPDIVMHLAAKAGVRPSIKRPKIYYDVNVNGTLNILNSMAKNNVKKMIFASSSSVYGETRELPFSENSSFDLPISPYGATKKSCEAMCYTFHYLHDISIYCLRFFTVFGPRQRPDLAIHKFTKQILEGIPITLYGEGDSKRDYTYIDDIISGLMSSLTFVKGFEIVNIGGSKTTSLKELIILLEKLIGKKALIKKYPLQSGDVSITYANIKKAKKMLGYNPSTSLEEGLKNFLNWYLEKRNNILK
jgi:UDP-glucuronate 4-epimerase